MKDGLCRVSLLISGLEIFLDTLPQLVKYSLPLAPICSINRAQFAVNRVLIEFCSSTRKIKIFHQQMIQFLN